MPLPSAPMAVLGSVKSGAAWPTFKFVWGAAGGVMAKQLATAGFKVVVLEQGPYLQEGDFQHDELTVGFRAGIINDHKRQPNEIAAIATRARWL